MTAYVALLRAVNVGGTGKLAMEDLRALATRLGFSGVRTHIASGNLLFSSALAEAEVKAALEPALEAHMGKAVPVYVRTAEEVAAIVAADPFPHAHGSRHMVFFLDGPPATDLIETARDRNGERIALGVREVFVDYGDNIRNTRLKLPRKQGGTGRNMNTVRKLAALLSGERG